jgi:hypothetical protein
VGLSDSGKVEEAEQFIIKRIIARIAKNSSDTQIVKAIQDRFVALGYMTRLQVNSGYGIFGIQVFFFQTIQKSGIQII